MSYNCYDVTIMDYRAFRDTCLEMTSAVNIRFDSVKSKGTDSDIVKKLEATIGGMEAAFSSFDSLQEAILAYPDKELTSVKYHYRRHFYSPRNTPGISSFFYDFTIGVEDHSMRVWVHTDDEVGSYKTPLQMQDIAKRLADCYKPKFFDSSKYPKAVNYICASSWLIPIALSDLCRFDHPGFYANALMLLGLSSVIPSGIGLLLCSLTELKSTMFVDRSHLDCIADNTITH